MLFRSSIAPGMTRSTQLHSREGAGRGRSVRLRDLSDDAEAPLATIGQDLRMARLARGEDLGSISYALKIRTEHLEAIEEDRFEALPGRTYAVGFVRAYAEYVGLDPVEAVERFKTEIAGRDQVSKTAGFPEDIEEPRLSRSWLFVAALVLLLIGYGVYYLFASGSTQTPQTVSAVPSTMTSKPKPRPNREISSNYTPAAPKTGGQALIQGPGAVSPVPPGQAQTGQVYGKMNTNPHVILRITQPTRILVQTEDGRAFINKELQAGDSYQVPNMRGLALTAEHGDAVQIIVNGKPVGQAGKTADPTAALPLDPDSLGARAGAAGTQ